MVCLTAYPDTNLVSGYEKSGAPECATEWNELVRPRLLLQEEPEGCLVEVGFDRDVVSGPVDQVIAEYVG
jgi:hypothetical protein